MSKSEAVLGSRPAARARVGGVNCLRGEAAAFFRGYTFETGGRREMIRALLRWIDRGCCGERKRQFLWRELVRQ